MKKFALMMLMVVFVSCLKNVNEIERLKYTENDVVPLNDSTKSLYYNDAAFIEFRRLIRDTTKRYEQVNLEESNILTYYDDLINIYNHSYTISNSFFDHVSSIHTFASHILYYIIVSVDTSKFWVEQWMNGNKHTGVTGIDSLTENYDLDVTFLFELSGGYEFKLKSRVPLNYFALVDKFKKTGEFRYVESDGLIGGGSTISIVAENDYKIYQYCLGWGDCPSGCLHYHFWKIKIENQTVTRIEEFGDPFN